MALLGAAQAAAEGTLYFADIFYPSFSDGYIYSVKTDGSELQMLVNTGGGLRSLAVDASAGKLYWTDVDDDAIRRADLDGSNPEDILTEDLSWPMAIALNPAADMLYWGDQTLAQIGSAHLDGAGAGPLLSTPFHSGLAVDADNGKIYWDTSITAVDGDIMRANLDGSNVEIVVTEASKPARLALDIAGGKIYWTDYVLDVVRRANLDGSDVEDLYVVGANLNPDGIALDLDEGKVYWGQAVTTNRDKIMRMNLDGSNPEDVLTGDFGIITCFGFIPEPSTPCPDLDGDGVVGLSDLARLLSNYGTMSGMSFEDGDIDGDGDVDLSDLALLLADYGRVCD
jgi:sugar lactone lactonase YvrE